MNLIAWTASLPSSGVCDYGRVDKESPHGRHGRQLAIHETRSENRRGRLGIAPTTPRAECERLLGDCLDAYVAWDLMHGWHDLWGWQNWFLIVLFSDC